MVTKRSQYPFKVFLLKCQTYQFIDIDREQSNGSGMIGLSPETSNKSMGNDPMLIPIIFHETV